MLKIAMSDEVDESTAMLKLASKRSQAPDQGYWLALDADRYDLPSDWYLRLAGGITRLFHGTLPMNPDMPIDPSNPGVVGLADGKPSPPGIYLVRPMGTGTGAAPVGGRLLLD